MFCSKCGNQLADGAKFCPNCGAPQNTAQQLQQQYQQPQYQQQQQYRQPQQPVQQTQTRQSRVRPTGAPRAAKKSGGGLLKKLLGTVAVVAVAAVGIPFISGVIEGVKEVKNDPPGVIQPIKNDGEMDFSDLMGYWKSKNGNFELRVEPGEPVSMRYTTPDGLFSSSNGISVDAKTGGVTLTAADGAKVTLTPQKSGSRLYIPEADVYLEKSTEEAPPPDGDKPGDEDEPPSGDICPVDFEGTMQLFELTTNEDVYNDPWRAQAITGWTAKVNICRDTVQMTVTPRPAYERWETIHSMSGFSLVGYVTKRVPQDSMTDIANERGVTRYLGVVDSDFDVTEDYKDAVEGRKKSDLTSRTLHAKGEKSSFQLDVYPNGQYTFTLTLNGPRTEYNRNGTVDEREASITGGWKFYLANRDKYYLYPDDSFVNLDPS